MDEKTSDNDYKDNSPYFTTSSTSDESLPRRKRYHKFLYKDYDLSQISNKTKKKYLTLLNS